MAETIFHYLEEKALRILVRWIKHLVDKGQIAPTCTVVLTFNIHHGEPVKMKFSDELSFDLKKALNPAT
jgi:hypothetical protein